MVIALRVHFLCASRDFVLTDGARSGVSEEALSLQLLGGKLKLENLRIRETAFADLELPVSASGIIAGVTGECCVCGLSGLIPRREARHPLQSVLQLVPWWAAFHNCNAPDSLRFDCDFRQGGKTRALRQPVAILVE